MKKNTFELKMCIYIDILNDIKTGFYLTEENEGICNLLLIFL